MIPVKLIQVVRQPLQHAAVLLDERGQRVLPIWIKGKEGYLVSAAFSSHWDRLVVHASGQPRMHFSNQFLWDVLEAVRDSAEEVRVDTLQEELFYGTVRLHLNATFHEIRTTIGMALLVAIRMPCPILVPEALLDVRGLSLPTEGATLEQKLTQMIRMLGKHLPVFPVTTQVAAKRPHNLDFSEGTQGWQHGEFIPSHSVSEGTQFLQFACEIDSGTTYQGHPSLSIQQTVEGMQAEGDLRQTFLADDYRGKRVHLSAFLKTREIGAAELRLQVEGLNEVLGQVGMQGGPLQGTHEWTRCTLEGEVPTESVAMELSLRVRGPGQVWLAFLHLEVVHENMSSGSHGKRTHSQDLTPPTIPAHLDKRTSAWSANGQGDTSELV